MPKETPQGRVYRIEVYSHSSAHYYCYCNIETARGIDDYQKERNDRGEILESNSPLFRDLKALNVRKVMPLTSYNIKYIVGKIIERSGVKNTFQFTGEAKRSKGLRKFYKTAAELAGMKPINVEITHGHSIGTAGHYFRPAESDILEDYISHAADALTIDPNQRLQKKIQELENDQGQEIARLKWREGQQAQEIVELKTQLKDVQLQTKGNKSQEAEVLTRLREKDDALVTLSDQVMKLMAEVQELKRQEE